MEEKNLFRGRPEFLKKFTYKYPYTKIVNLAENEQLYLKDPVRALECLYVLSGAIEIKLELKLTHKIAERVQLERNRNLLNIDEHSENPSKMKNASNKRISISKCMELEGEES